MRKGLADGEGDKVGWRVVQGLNRTKKGERAVGHTVRAVGWLKGEST